MTGMTHTSEKRPDINPKEYTEEKENLKTEIISSIAAAYMEIIILDCEKKIYYAVADKKDDYHTIRSKGTFEQLKRKIIETNIAPEYRDNPEIKAFLDLDTLQERMTGKDNLSLEIKSVNGRWYMALFIATWRNSNKHAGRILFLIRDIDEQKQAELKKDEKLKEQLSVFDGLARNFKNVYMVDIKHSTAKILKLEDEHNDARAEDLKDHIFPYENLLNAWISEAVHPDDRKMLSYSLSAQHLREVFSKNKEYTGNYRMLVDGKVINYQFNLIATDKERYIIAGFQNIEDIIQRHYEEERKQRQKDEAYQREVNKQLAIINSLSSNFRNVFIANLKSGTAKAIRITEDYSIKALADVREKIFPFGVIIEQWIKDGVHPDDRAKVMNALDIDNLRMVFSKENEYIGTYRSIEKGSIHNFQFDIRKVDDYGNIVCGFQNIDSIIAEHERQRELEEAHLKGLKEHAEVISSLSTIYSTIFRAEIDTHHYEVLNSVDLMNNLTGTGGNFDDVKGNIISAFMAPEMRESMYEFLDLDTLDKRLKDINTVSAEYRDPAGAWFQARFIVKRRDESGAVKEVLYVARDITDEKMREFEQQEQLVQALSAAQQANKAKSTFLNSMSHDIRTPMNAIIGFTSLAQTHIGDQMQVQDYLAKISTSSTHLLNLINDILDMSRIESGTVKLEEKPLHIPDLLRDLKTMIQGLVASKNQNIYIDTQDVVHEDVLTDKLRLNQVLINIVGNAVKFTQSGGNIVVRLIEKPSRIKNHAVYEFSVKDNGIGMSEEFIEHIFDTFSREHSSTISGIQGTGLGMAITKNIVDMMGGDIKVKSEEGKGSVFTVTLNLQLAGRTLENESSSELIRTNAAAGGASDTGRNGIPADNCKTQHDYSGRRILLVEDNELNREIATEILKETGMKVNSVNDGDVAVAAINNAPADKYDLVFMDIQMPKMDGYTAAREIRTLPDNRKANIPIIAMTANAFEEDRQKAFASGMNGYVIKPISIDDITSVLDAVFKESAD